MQLRKVEVIPYQREWILLYKEEKQRILKIMEPDQIVIHHIGSTSVHGLSAKPIIDILAEVNDIKIIDLLTPELVQVGYSSKGENSIKGRRFFIKSNEIGERLYHLHAFQKGSPEINRHLVFRDYLRMHPKEAQRYAKIKETAAKKFPFDIEAYMDFKNPIIKELEQEAKNWSNKREESR
ncbi:GrpB family protein [Neobacillus sp. PS3-40]|uniref:GrpB family protein n=1 Tax=Neobacillus sp. PS3-40 TaxID=3070679 RepID=UPI0027E0B42A|nr:GrpB family protein [Neobacillus sp. PS3-40]WML45193.1 GrpB family protein [Neobacillus sp. PS3-40]